MILAGIVTFNPELDKLSQNIESILNQVDKLLIVDNNSKNKNEIKVLIKQNGNKVDFIENLTNLGIATALNQILDYSYKNNYEWFLTLDQDTISVGTLINVYKNYINEKNVAMIVSNFKDVNVNDDVSETYEVKKIDRCITSGTLNNTIYLKNVGGYDDKMFIDYVDYDLCQTLIEHNYKILKIDFIGYMHEVGKSTQKYFFGKKIIVYNENPIRVYFFIRNQLYFINKHRKNINLFKEYWILLKNLIKILFFQKNFGINLKSIIKGIKDSKKMLKGEKIEKI